MKKKVYFILLVSLIFVTGISYAKKNAKDFPVLKGPYLGQKPPGMTPEIFAPGIVSTGKEHSSVMFTADGKEVWFGRMFPAKIYYMNRIDDKWSGPQIAPVCDTYNYLYPVLTQDGRRIFFTSNRPVEQKGKPLSRSEGDILKE